MSGPGAGNGALTPLAEQRLIEAAKRGCADSAHALIAAHQDRLHAFVWRMVRNDHEAEEVCQDAFLRAFSALASFDPTYRFSTWLFTIGYRLCLNVMRRRREFAGDIDLTAMPATGADGEDEASVGDEIANSDEARRLKEVIWGSVDQLTAPQRAAVLLFYRESMSCHDIGAVLNIPASTVKSHLHRARNRLKEMLSEQLVEDWTVVRFAEAAPS